MALRFLAVACAALLGACATENPAATPVAVNARPAETTSPERVASSTPAIEPSPAPEPSPEPEPAAKPRPATPPQAGNSQASKPQISKPEASKPQASKPQVSKPQPKPSPPAPTAEPAAQPKPERAAVQPPQPAPLDLESLEARLKDTSAIGLLTKLSLKNQVDDLVTRFRKFHAGTRPPTLQELRPSFDLLLMKVLSLLQDRDPALAHDVSASREAIWAVLTDPRQLAKFS